MLCDLNLHWETQCIAVLLRKSRPYLVVHMSMVKQNLSNSGLRERHWEMMGQELGFEVKHGEDMTLSSMIDAGVHKLGDRLQEISSSASKEFALEKAMGKMKDEWEHVR